LPPQGVEVVPAIQALYPWYFAASRRKLCEGVGFSR
jgi:hypothetical protein